MNAHGPASLRSRLSAGDRLVGGLVRMPSQELVEMMAVAGFDFVLVDCEHGAPDLADLRHHVTAAEAFGLPVMVRPGEHDPAFALRALDLGVGGLVVPHVDSAVDADAAVRAVRYPPRGSRGFALYSRAGRYGAVDAQEHRQRADDVLLLAMIESPRAVLATDEIVGVDGIDGYLIGTSDLGATRGPQDPPLDELVTRTHRTAATTGAWRADLAGDAATARASLEGGAHLVVHNVTMAMMELLRELRV
ncbi:HpcH/HpaI aldolase/citrate lyase family protein [Aeromicrobium sp. CF4.19]|uniref:HpcH/HpaI aldolase family protein n=1 Tax=Aeromicrobium sp. CF4.19 TaxID=3373082 RepID=UPI003EE63598